MRRDTDGPSWHAVSTRAVEGLRLSEHEAGMNQEIRMARRVGAVDLQAIPTINLIAELARRERIALRLAIEEALAPVSEAKARPAAR